MDKEHKKDSECNCVFCKMFCPECGAREIYVRIRYEYNLANYSRKIIEIKCVDLDMDYECQSCGAQGKLPADGPNGLAATLLVDMQVPSNMNIKLAGNAIEIERSYPVRAEKWPAGE